MLDGFQQQELEKIKNDPMLIKDAPEELKANEEFMLEVIRLSAFAMAHVAPELQNKKSFVLAAIALNGWAYNYTLDKWRDNESVTRFAVRKDPVFLFAASERLMADEDFKTNALKINSWYPWIRLNKFIKNNFFEGLGDTFAIMYGNYGILEKLDGKEFDPNILKHGLIDITLIPQLSNFLINYGAPTKPCYGNPFRYAADNEKRKDATIIRNISLAIGFGLQFLRFAMAAAATVMVLPIVALVHMLKFPYTYYYQRNLLQLEGVIYDARNNEPASEKTTLAEFISRTNSSLNDLCGYKSSNITSYSYKNTEVETYGSVHSSSPLLFFKPLNSTKPSQVRAKEIATALEIDEQYDPNNSRARAIGRSFY
ncbi:type III secretion system effector protein [Legionella qingyii]|uniref:DUF4116 domain-containing protein n=1 Tax=Legionella qingyii TaxID=2184757 RepID=A0A317U905_9GAMM|nr:DUF4116 domain-containing protein [Legionella qingyii]PWY57678.1 type III secretion system effector protein [Legionella qingyii]RUR25855.1 DUF4116 domain-containing protein [Legionella qingyii]RUR29244.1 DUF4116 domain-containing protein [Legionella qingyii]